MTDKQKYPRAAALDVARELVAALRPVCVQERLVVAGSLRRGKDLVGDVEIVYVPMQGAPTGSLFDLASIDLADEALDRLLARRELAMRLNSRGNASWGQKNKLALHTASGIPVDLFATSEACWFNYLVCRTGPAELNVLICQKANQKGWKWNPYGRGFTRGGPLTGQQTEEVAMESEEAVFEFVGLPYREPKMRG